jgi:hypothetical protein
MGVMAIFVALSHSIASLFLPTPPRAEGGDTRDLVVAAIGNIARQLKIRVSIVI